MSKIKKGDMLIVCGDFGFLWDDSKQEKRIRQRICRLPYHVLFVEGGYDNYDLLAQYPTVAWGDGQARHIGGNCYHLLRGQIYTLEDKRFFTFGGCESANIDEREEGKSWWPAELPGEEEIISAWENLARVEYRVDYIVTHTPSRGMGEFLRLKSPYAGALSAFLDEVEQKVTFTRWFFGRYHTDKTLLPRHQMLYVSVLPVQ